MEITIQGQTYRIAKLSAMQQFHISRRISPLVSALAPGFEAFISSNGGANTKSFLEILPQFQPFTEALSSMDDKGAEEIVGMCLSAVTRKQDQSYSPVWNKAAKTVMFDDIDAATMLTLVVRAITENLGPFLQGLLTGQILSEQT